MPRRLSTAAYALPVVAALLLAPASGADPIADAIYKGKVRGDGDKIEFNTSTDGRTIGSLVIQFDSRCRQGGKDYTNENTELQFFRTKIRPSGKFKAREKRNYPGGGDVSVAKGRFSEDGKTAAGSFSFDGTFSGGGIERVECSASGRFKARTKADPADGGPGDVPSGVWRGTTAQGLPIQFDTVKDGLREIEIVTEVDCVRENGGAFTQERYAVIDRAPLAGSTFEATQHPDHIRGSFDGRTASGVVSVASYYDDFDFATCSTPGEVSFTARLRD